MKWSENSGNYNHIPYKSLKNNYYHKKGIDELLQINIEHNLDQDCCISNGISK